MGEGIGQSVEEQLHAAENEAAARIENAEHVLDLTEAIDTMVNLPIDAETAIDSIQRTKKLVKEKIDTVLATPGPQRETLLDEAAMAAMEIGRDVYGTTFDKLLDAMKKER